MHRPRVLFSLVLLLLSTAALADANLSVELSLSGTPFHDRGTPVTATVRNAGPDAAAGVVLEWSALSSAAMLSADSRCQPSGDLLRCTIGSLAAGASTTVLAEQPGRAPVLNEIIDARVTSTTADANPDNNLDVLAYRPVMPRDDLRGEVAIDPEFTQPGNTLTFRYAIRNLNPDFRAPLVLKISIPKATTIVSKSESCAVLSTAAGAQIQCALDIAPSATVPIEVVARFAENFGFVITTAEMIWKGYSDDVVARTGGQMVFGLRRNVTTAGDEGPGSLREVIKEVNTLCEPAVPCVIGFNIAQPVPAEGWYTIRPLTPLPDVTLTKVTLEGATQTALTGDTNPRGPEIFLDGSALTSGNGLVLRGENVFVHDLAIGNFPDNGIYIEPRTNRYNGTYTISRNYIGLDPTGTRAMPNLRGVASNGGTIALANNVISGNRYSAVFIWESHYFTCVDSRIGVAAASDDPIPNGSSGIFVRYANQGMLSRLSISGNVIANNGHFGVSYPRSVGVLVGKNRIFDNANGGVDIDLDGPTSVKTPRIERAYFDGEDTIIEGMLPARVTGSQSSTYAVLLYANTKLEAGGYAEGERFIGEANGDAAGRFTFRYDGDLRGLFVNGMTLETTNHFGEWTTYHTFEFGQAIPVTNQP